eukprot:GFUD01037749.1.p1 GENE.GFUD01037749.1~~GFUD01037749.1.p1  ORF type:complete len:172 (+),score=27.77 GFUD01037749.1:47-517(+)
MYRKSVLLNLPFFLLLIVCQPILSDESAVNFEPKDAEGSGISDFTVAQDRNGTSGSCSVATSSSTGLMEYIYTLREMIQPNRTTTGCNTQESDCILVQCCFSEADTSVRPGYKGQCILTDWVLPLSGGLVLALFLALCLCLCCCCCSRKKKQEYDL